MEKPNYICGGITHAYGQGYLALPISLEGLPPRLQAGNLDLHAKATFHVSLMCVKNLIRKHGNNIEDEILGLFCSYTKEHEVNFVKYTGEFRFAETMERKTIIALCEISNLDNFFRFAEQQLNISIPLQPTHVTLYTLQPEMGIGLNSADEMQQKTQPIEVPREVEQVLEKYNRE
ncbi:MAG: hypothetical protein JWN49_427 [Parcubacteria group bacterium]|nr:hypothetical protein [Parcubacteria group bacterium]